MHYLLFYEVAEDYVSRRAEFRDAHLQKAWEASERGELVLGVRWRNRSTARCCCLEVARQRSRRNCPS